ncbi:MAG: NACHT domain-containing protein [Elainella sp. Prado103]|jgi:hypothetical protein|nr:NACHT domain-containing protein [Elainella sp. Prado103]
MVLVSKQGIAEVDRRRIERGWNRKSCNFRVAAATIGRFWSGQRHLKKDSLHAIFTAVGISDWHKYLIEPEVVGSQAIETQAIETQAIETQAINPVVNVDLTPVGMLASAPPNPPALSPHLWDGVPDYPIFYGREKELGLLSRWILEERYRVVALLGFGGIGKTALVAQLTKQVASQFQAVIWRSLRSTPPIDDFLLDLLETLTGESIEPKSTTRLIKELISHLNQTPILLVFDGWEEVLGGEYGGFYQQPHQLYKTLLEELGQQKHQSCIVITSREKQAHITLLGTGIRYLVLQKLDFVDASKLLHSKGLRYLDRPTVEKLVQLYYGNPLALQLAASKIRDQFDGDVSTFLAQEPDCPDELFMRTVLERQMGNLNPAEQQMLMILAQDAEPIDRPALGVRFTQQCQIPVSTSDILASLERRSLVERISETGQVLYTLQPVVRQYVQRHLTP